MARRQTAELLYPGHLHLSWAGRVPFLTNDWEQGLSESAGPGARAGSLFVAL